MERRWGMILAISVPLVAGITTTRDLDFGGLNISGLIWFAQLLAACALIVMEKTFHSEDRIKFPVWPWLICFGYFWLSLLWGDSLGRRNLQDALQITMPLVMAITGALFIRTEAQLAKLLWAYKLAIVPLLYYAALVIEMPTEPGTDALRLLGLTGAFLGCIFAAHWPQKTIGPALGFVTSMVCVIAAGGRTAAAGLLVVMLFHPLLRSVKWRAALITAVVLVGLGVFYSEKFQQRFFYSGSGSVSDLVSGRIRGAGRFEAWPLIWQEAARRPVFGHGMGAAYDFVPTVWPGMNHVHNEFLRLVFDVGFVGLFLYVAVFAYQLAATYKLLQHARGITQVALAACFLGLLLFVVTATTGNPLPSNVWFTNPLFLLLGAAYGVLPTQAPADRSRTPAPVACETRLTMESVRHA